jgi:hypothetical protein
MKPSYISIEQWRKVAKALAYSFASGFTGTLALMALDFIKAAHDGTASVINLGVALLVAAVIGGINAVVVAAVQLFKDPEA